MTLVCRRALPPIQPLYHIDIICCNHFIKILISEKEKLLVDAAWRWVDGCDGSYEVQDRVQSSRIAYIQLKCSGHNGLSFFFSQLTHTGYSLYFWREGDKTFRDQMKTSFASCWKHGLYFLLIGTTALWVILCIISYCMKWQWRNWLGGWLPPQPFEAEESSLVSPIRVGLVVRPCNILVSWCTCTRSCLT